MKKFLERTLAATIGVLAMLWIGCSADSSGGNGEQTETEKNGTVSIAATVSKVTVTFSDSEYDGKKDDVVVTLVQGQNSSAKIPKWTRTGYKLTSWESSLDGITVKNALSEDVTFTAQWTKFYTVTFKDSEVEGFDTNADVTQEILEDAATRTASVPSWTKTGYTLSWESSVDTLTAESEITEDVTFTAKWTARTAYTVTFKDSENGNDDVAEKVYDGDKVSNVPAWTKEHYTLSWDGDTTEAITDNVTFTAIWTENRYYTVKFVDSEISADVTGGEAIAAESDATNDTQKVYDGEKAVLPAWASSERVNKAAYTVTWTSSVSGLTPDSALTAADGVTEITFTASWAKTPTILIFNLSTSTIEGSVNDKLTKWDKVDTTGTINGDGTYIGAINYSAYKCDSAGFNLYGKSKVNYIEIVVLKDVKLTFKNSSNSVYFGTTKPTEAAKMAASSDTEYVKDNSNTLSLTAGTYYIYAIKDSAKVPSLTVSGN